MTSYVFRICYFVGSKIAEFVFHCFIGLKKISSTIDPNALMGVYNGTEFVFLGSRWKIINYFKLLWRYGFDLITLNSWVKGLLNDFSNIYGIQKGGKAFSSVPELLKAMGGDKMYKYTQQNIREALQGIGVKDRLIDELVTAVMRVNYGQDAEINAFAGAHGWWSSCYFIFYSVTISS